jgi:hypothetical protein
MSVTRNRGFLLTPASGMSSPRELKCGAAVCAGMHIYEAWESRTASGTLG